MQSAGGLTFAVAGRVSHTADHDLTAAQTVGGVRVCQATLIVQINRLHHLKTQSYNINTSHQQQQLQLYLDYNLKSYVLVPDPCVTD